MWTLLSGKEQCEHSLKYLLCSTEENQSYGFGWNDIRVLNHDRLSFLVNCLFKGLKLEICAKRYRICKTEQ